jgi:hypothetical protein
MHFVTISANLAVAKADFFFSELRYVQTTAFGAHGKGPPYNPVG